MSSYYIDSKNEDNVIIIRENIQRSEIPCDMTRRRVKFEEEIIERNIEFSDPIEYIQYCIRKGVEIDPVAMTILIKNIKCNHEKISIPGNVPILGEIAGTAISTQIENVGINISRIGFLKGQYNVNINKYRGDIRGDIQLMNIDGLYILSDKSFFVFKNEYSNVFYIVNSDGYIMTDNGSNLNLTNQNNPIYTKYDEYIAFIGANNFKILRDKILTIISSDPNYVNSLTVQK